jgi:REP element-mobilizing transposase RayT
MPRKARITIAGAVHHVMSRGIDGMPIFRSDADRTAFLAILSNQLQKSGYQLYAWVLMPNHYHLVLRTTDYPLAACMRSVNSRYAQYFRKQLSTRGYLFQDRYKSIVTQDQNYVEELIRYVHLNPVRAGICKSIDALDSYQWCGHSVLMGRQDAPYQNTADVLRRFGSSLVSQRQAYRRFLEEGLSQTGDVVSLIREANGECEDRHSSSCWVIGNHDFVQQVMKDQQARRVRLARHAREGQDIEHIAEKVTAALGLAAADLRSKGRDSPSSVARKICAHHAHRLHGIPVRQIADYLGVSSSAVSQMLEAGETLAKDVELSY